MPYSTMASFDETINVATVISVCLFLSDVNDVVNELSDTRLVD